MARFLICTHPITGHVNPPLEIARELVERGHEVRFYTGRKFQTKIEAVGARYEPMRRAYDYDDSDYDTAFPGRAAKKGIAQIRFDFEHIFIAPGLDQAVDLREILDEWPAVVLSDPGFLGAKLLYQRGELDAWAVFNITVLGLPSDDVPPFGLGLLPLQSRLGRLRNRAVRLFANKVVFASVNRALRRTLAAAELPPEDFTPVASPMLYLQPSVAALEYPRRELVSTAHFTGPVLPRFGPDVPLPSWWSEVTETSKPVVVVTQGTVATDRTELILPAVAALADEDVLVVATVDGTGLNLPANVRTAKFVPFDRLMPHADVVVTNGGYGGVIFALANGVPVICAGTTEDKPEVANRVAYTGAGINLKTNRPAQRKISEAVRTVLSHNDFRDNARRLAGILAERDGTQESVRLLEILAATRAPVHRTGGDANAARRAKSIDTNRSF